MSEGDASRGNARFMFFHSFCASIEKIKNPEDQLATFWAITRYGLYGVEPTDGNMIAEIVLESVRPVIDQSRKLSKIRSENGTKGGRPKNFAFGCDESEKQTKANESKTETGAEQTKANESRTETGAEQTKANESGEGGGSVGGVVGGLVGGFINGEGEGGDTIHGEGARGANSAPSLSPSWENPPDELHGSNQTNSLRASYPKAYDFWERIRKVYPPGRRHTPDYRTLRFINERKLWEQEEAITKSIVAWSNCDEWKLGYALRMSRFIEEEHWKEEPPPPKGVETVHRIYTSYAPIQEYTGDDSDVPFP